MKSWFIIGIILSLAVTTISCKKKKAVPDSTPVTTLTQNEETETVETHAFAINVLNDISTMGGQIVEGGALSTYKQSSNNQYLFLHQAPCASVSIMVNTVTIDFGSQLCYGQDGLPRTGKLIYDFSISTNGANSYRMPGFAFKVSSVDYKVSGVPFIIDRKSVV